MNIVSYGFVILFLPITIILYWRVARSKRLKLWVLCIISYLFYALGGVYFIPLLLGLSLLTFWLARRHQLFIGIILNSGVLFAFKLLGFGSDNLTALGLAGNPGGLASLLNLALPLGLSFYTFKHIGYLLDVRQG